MTALGWKGWRRESLVDRMAIIRHWMMTMAQAEPSRAHTIANKSLTSLQAQAVALLSSGESMRATAKMVGVDTVTIWRWSKLADFAEAIERVRAMRLAQIDDRLAEAQEDALESLVQLAKGAEGEAVRFNAAKYIIDRRAGAPGQSVAVSNGDSAEAHAWLKTFSEPESDK